jgi:hypothetical protein
LLIIAVGHDSGSPRGPGFTLHELRRVPKTWGKLWNIGRKSIFGSSSHVLWFLVMMTKKKKILIILALW